MVFSKVTRIRKAYLNPAEGGGFASAAKLYRSLQADPNNEDIKRKDVDQWLRGVESYTMSRTSVRKISRKSRIPIQHVGEQWDSDLMDMQSNAKDNQGMRFILVVIDIFSRFLWTRPLKSKMAKDIIAAFKSIFEDTESPQRIRTDGGSEYTNHNVRGFFKVKGVDHYVTQSEHKAYFAERVIKTLRSLMSRYMIQKNTKQWVDVLPKLTTNYNTSLHSSIKMSPIQVTADNEDQVWANQTLLPLLEKKPIAMKKESEDEKKPKTKRNPPFKVKVGDHVRISYKKRAFERVFDSKFSGEVFVVVKRYRRQGRPIYQLEDLQGENLKGAFNNNEIQKIKVKSNPKYTIEKILKRKTVRGQKMVFVKWLYYPKKFNSWIEASQVHRLKSTPIGLQSFVSETL